MPRREGRRRRLCHSAPDPQAPRLHDRQVQGSDDSQRSAPDPSGPRSTSSGAACRTRRCPAGPTLSDSEVSDLAYYIKTFSADFAVAENVPKPMELPSGPAATSESIELGKKAYEENGCLKCHGTLGRGDGPSASTLTDDLGHPIRAANLTQPWTFRGGPTREDIFRTMTTGLNGTPMPSFADALTPEQRWAITDFITSLSGNRTEPGYTNLVVAKYALDPIDLAKGAASFESAPVARLPIVGQIMEPGRQFNPPATSVMVQAIYDAESIAFLVRWHDMGADRTGKNDPTLPVPPEEELVKRGAAAGSGATSENRLRRSGSDPAPGRGGPLCRAGSDSGPAAIRVLRRGVDPDSDDDADERPQAVLHLRRLRELGGSLVLRSGPPRAPSVHRPRKRGHRAERHGGCHRRGELRPGRMVGHFQAAASRQRGRPVRARRVSADRPLGVGRVLARPWQQARSHVLVLHLRRAASCPIGHRSDGEDGAAHSRHRAGRDRLGAVASCTGHPRELGREPSHPAATRA